MRLIGGAVLILVLYLVLSQPVTAAEMTRSGVGQLGGAGDRAATFVTSVVSGTGSGTTTVVPTGGVAAGDGSSAP